ncbi:MAG: hypothetical protein OXG11_02345 [Chloroflexi bacterium]|nr:hypothetical protein [Chloroflexota bacterium]
MAKNRSGAASDGSYYARGAGRKSISSLSVVRLLFLPYLDPGSGSFLIQILIAAVLGGVVSVGLWFRRILGIFRRSSGEGGAVASLEDVESTEADRRSVDGPGDDRDR